MSTFCLSLFSYIILLLTIVKLPEKAWDWVLKSGSLTLLSLKESQKKWPFLGERKRGQELLIAFADCESKVSLGIKILPKFLPQYKFYTNLLELLFENYRRLGIGIKKILPEIRSGMVKDLQFEKKIFDEIVSGLWQFMIIAVTTWSFVFLSSTLADIPRSWGTTLWMGVLQISGVIAFFYLVSIFKSKIFYKFSKSIEELYLFTSLLDVGLPLNEILSRSGILNGNLTSYKSFETISFRLNQLVSRLKETGLSPKEESQEIIREIWHLQEESFHKFTKIVQVLKFSILVFFFLPAYFLYLYSIFQFFMEQ